MGSTGIGRMTAQPGGLLKPFHLRSRRLAPGVSRSPLAAPSREGCLEGSCRAAPRRCRPVVESFLNTPQTPGQRAGPQVLAQSWRGLDQNRALWVPCQNDLFSELPEDG